MSNPPPPPVVKFWHPQVKLRTLMLAPLVIGALIILVRPTLLTGHWCYVTIDEIKSSAPGSCHVKYRYLVTTGTTFRCLIAGSGGGSSSGHGLFRWYRYSYGQSGGGEFVEDWDLSPAEIADGVKLEAGKTYWIPVNSQLTIYEIRNRKTGEMVYGYFSFYENHKAPIPIGRAKRGRARSTI